MPISLAHTRKNPPATTHKTLEDREVKAVVRRFLQEQVNLGHAEWRTNTIGQTELHMRAGEAFVVLETGLKRLK